MARRKKSDDRQLAASIPRRTDSATQPSSAARFVPAHNVWRAGPSITGPGFQIEVAFPLPGEKQVGKMMAASTSSFSAAVMVVSCDFRGLADFRMDAFAHGAVFRHVTAGLAHQPDRCHIGSQRQRTNLELGATSSLQIYHGPVKAGANAIEELRPD
jgi:hypothetical protein